MRMLTIATLTIAMVSPVAAQDAAMAAKSLGYALQAATVCDGLIVLSHTETGLERRYGRVLRGDKTALNEEFHSGALRFLSDVHDPGEAQACALAFSRVGPDGVEYPGLLLDNPLD